MTDQILPTLLSKLSRGILAVAVTVGLFVFMNKLITQEASAFGKDDFLDAITFENIDLEPEETETSRRKPPPKPEPPTEPQRPKIDMDPTDLVTPTPVAIDMPTLPTGTGPSINIGPQGTGFGGNGSVRMKSGVPPMYPPTGRGRRGEVTVEFTVTATGHVIDAVVIHSAPKRVFDRAALQAITRWTFWPRTVDGEPVATRVTQTFDFTVEES